MVRPLLACAAVLAALLACAGPAAAVQPGVNVVPGQRLGGADGAAKVGARWLRVWAVWDAVEPVDGTFSLNIVDGLTAEVAAAKARGLKVLVVVHRTPAWASGTSDLTAPPADPARFGRFMGELAQRVPAVDAWEIWNEPDDPAFLRGAPDAGAYAGLLRAAYAGIKRVQPGDVVATGGTVANDADFVEDLYRHGAQGSFDAVGVHTDTACLTVGPDFVYRDELGRVGRYVFTGYREVHDVMARHGDGAKAIWMTELGWNTASTRPGSCDVGGRAGTKPRGVTRRQQARFLTAAYRCLAADPYVGPAFWFGLQDVPGAGAGYGLFDRRGRAKRAAGAFRRLRRGVRPARRCGGVVDHVAPALRVALPVAGLRFADRLAIDARAADNRGGAGLRRIELWADGRKVRSFGGGRARLAPWWGSRRLGVGPHTITLRALDRAHNVAEASFRVEKVPGARPAP